MANKRILIVCAEPSGAVLISNYLNSQGYCTVLARGGQEGYQKFREEHPDLLLCDMLMPQQSGPELARRVRGTAEGEHLPFIMMAGLIKSPRLEQELSEGLKINACLQKPFEMTELLEQVRGLIGDNSARPGKVHKVVSNGVIKAFAGTFADKSYPKVLHLLCKRKATGVLECKGDRKRISVFFKDGRPCNVRSNYIREGSLTRILSTMVSLDKNQIDGSRKLQQQRGLQQGEALVEYGAITRDDLSNALRIQSEEKLLTPFGWQEGGFEFTERPVVVDPDLMLKTPLPQIILRGVSQYYPSERIRSSFKDKGGRKVFVNPERTYRLEDFGLTADELFAASMARSEPTLGQILSSAKLGTVRTYQILYVLFVLETFKFRDEPAAETAENNADEPRPAPALRLDGLTDDVSGDKAEAHYQRAMTLFEAKDYKGAAAHLEQAIQINNREPRYLAQMALVIFRMPLELKVSYLDPNVLLQRAANLDRNCLQLNLVMGRLSKEFRELDKARMFFERVLQIDPQHAEAATELRLLQLMQRQMSA